MRPRKLKGKFLGEPWTMLGPTHRRRSFPIRVALVFVFAQGSFADNLVFESGPRKVQLLELFTSEGCSSCPPAEASLSELVSDPRLWREIVPVAFHVDYWDRLGWKDSFASSEWTKRQQTYAENWKAESLYTPMFVLAGRERSNADVPAQSGERPGILKVEVREGDAVSVNFEPVNPISDEFEVYLARLAFGINVNVRAGENSGRILRHDFVVLSLAHEKLHRQANPRLGSYSVAGEVHLSPAPKSGTRLEHRALAVWISKSGEIKPIQATGGWLR